MFSSFSITVEKRDGDWRNMDYFITIWSVVVFVENRLTTKLDYAELDKSTGFSLAHIRDIFAKNTGQSLCRYILGRRVARAAFDLIHTEDNIMEISQKYNFASHDSFTRAFKRITGVTPSQFRQQRLGVSRIMLCAGVYGVGITK